MISRNLLACCGVATLLMGSSATAADDGPVKLPGGFSIALLPGFTHEPLQGIDSIVGQIVQADGLRIQYEMGNIPAPGALRLGGSFVNQALQLPEQNRLWLKEQKAGGRTILVAYGKDLRLIVSSVTAKEGINFHAEAKTPAEVADVLLMVLTLTQEQPKRGKKAP
ncbi:MAG: hypothetical protein AB7O62_06400 [Pirellulales bacterium]